MRDSSDYNYQDSLSLDTGGIPSKSRVEVAIKGLEIGWFEAWRIRIYYRWARLRKAWNWPKVFWFLGTVVLWAAIVVVLIILALAAG